MSGELVETILKLILGGAITTALFALCIWFITRYIKQRDDFESDVNKQIKNIPAEIKDKLTDVKVFVDKTMTEVKSHQTALSDEVHKFKMMNLEFQQKMNSELTAIEKHVISIENTIDRTSQKASSLESTVTKMNEQVQFHGKLLESLVKWAKQAKIQIEESSENYKTTTKKISDDLIILKKKVDNK